MHGKIIIIEGLDGCGKTTQVNLLKNIFPDCRFLTFPNYHSYSGEIITDYLQGNIPETDTEKNCYSASMFYAIDRYISYRKDWHIDYQNQKNIISARYTTSNAIYQMTKLSRDKWQSYYQWLCDLEYQKLGIPKPDEVIFLDVPVAVSQKLLSERYNGKEEKKDIHEADSNYLQKCHDVAMYVAKQEHWKILQCCENNTMRSVNAIQEELKKLIMQILQD
ncbi:MAG: deoxynucleoside kinase [Oscillospiraceae bacterium]|nr:deoxynucleoside kinase [Oscillospiraceae bacterium]